MSPSPQGAASQSWAGRRRQSQGQTVQSSWHRGMMCLDVECSLELFTWKVWTLGGKLGNFSCLSCCLATDILFIFQGLDMFRHSRAPWMTWSVDIHGFSSCWAYFLFYFCMVSFSRLECPPDMTLHIMVIVEPSARRSFLSSWLLLAVWEQHWWHGWNGHLIGPSLAWSPREELTKLPGKRSSSWVFLWQLTIWWGLNLEIIGKLTSSWIHEILL